MYKNGITVCFFICLCCHAIAQTEKFTSGKYEELTDTKPHDGDEKWSQQPKTQLSWGSIDVRYAKRNVPETGKSSRLSLKAWKGERVNAQAVLWTKTDLSQATVSVSSLVCGTSVIPAESVKTNFVRYVMTDGFGSKAKLDSSLVADVLDTVKFIDVKARTVQPVWVNVWTPSDIKAGKYSGKLTVSGKNFAPMTLNLEIEVINRTLPPPKDWSFHLDLWQNPYSVARYNQVPLWSDAHFDAMRPVMKILANAGQKVITTTIVRKPWNGQTEDHFDAMIGKIKKIDGSWSYDYTVFDRWVEFMYSVGIDRQINCYTLLPWALNFDYYDQATGQILYTKAEPGSVPYNEYWGNFIADFAKHLRQKGWFEKTVIAMDERSLETMREAIRLIKSTEPDFKISLAGNYFSEIGKDIYDLCLAFGREFTADVKASRQNAGQKSTVYTCCVEALPNTFTFSPPAEAAWIGLHAMAKNYDGYLRWAYNSWTADPLRDSRFRTWPAGDCYLVYPGRSSIRMERLVEGIQDYEKCRILKNENNQKQNARLNLLLNQFTADELAKQGAGKMIENIRKVLNE
ncbi:MAG: DUF4091 domain-containing protein [Prevotellaceae bacterium]|jgi:hypothetical protein|nr:DUF4091 domain-containing protein [Prevotellaceae bacterium]